MADHPRGFVWYELLTTDVSGAKGFYSSVLGWEAQDASTPNLSYTLFTAAKSPVCGLMDLPEEARKMGAWPRWMGYVEVNDVKVTVEGIRRLGGAVYVPPTDTNIGFISVVTDPQTATFGLIEGLKPGRRQPLEPGKPGRVGWHELHATDWEKAFVFYGEVFGWQKPDAEISQAVTYQPFSAGGQTIGGMFTKLPEDPLPFWLFYLNVEDLDAAVERVRIAGGQVSGDAVELLDGSCIARCIDPQGAAFALQGKQGHTSKLGWSTEWSGFSSRGRILTPKPRPWEPPDSES